MSNRRLPPVTQAIPKLPAVNEGSVIVDDTAKSDTGCVAIQQLYEDMRSDWTNGGHREKSAKNGLDRTLPQVVYLSICTYLIISCCGVVQKSEHLSFFQNSIKYWPIFKITMLTYQNQKILQ